MRLRVVLSAILVGGLLSLTLFPFESYHSLVFSQEPPWDISGCSTSNGPAPDSLSLRWTTEKYSIADSLLGITGPRQQGNSSIVLDNSTYRVIAAANNVEFLAYPDSSPQFPDLLHVSRIKITSAPFGGTVLSFVVTNFGTNEIAWVNFALGTEIPSTFLDSQGASTVNAGSTAKINISYYGTSAPVSGSSAVIQTTATIYYGRVHCPYTHIEDVPLSG
jgi:hypothetical protein